MTLTLTYDQDKHFDATPGFISSLEAMAREYLKMMREADPEYADCWTFCEVVIGDVADAGFVEFLSGGDDERPEGMTDEVRVRVRQQR
jgi:hypothetical protein